MKTLAFFRLALFTIIISLLFVPSVYAQWEPDRRLTMWPDSSLTSWNNAHSIATGTGGYLHVVWGDYRDGGYAEIYYKRSTDHGASWSQDIRLTDPPVWAEFPSVSALDSNVIIVWEDHRGGADEIYYKRSTDQGTTWSQDMRLTIDSSASYSASIWVSGSHVHVVWVDYVSRSYNSEIFYVGSTDRGATWLQAIRLTYNSSWSELPSVWTSDSNVVVVWYDMRDGNREIYAKRSTDWGATWSQDVRLTNDPDWSFNSSVSGSDSYVYAVWQESRDGNSEIYAKRSPDWGATWSQDVRLTYDSAWSGLPTVSALGPNVHVAWWDDRDGSSWNREIYYKRSTDRGTTWSQDTRLTFDPSYSLYPSLAISDSMVNAVWTDYRDGNYEVYYKRNPTGNSGIEENIKSRSIDCSTPTVHPNPFISFATVQEHKGERFVLYDISGRKVGIYKRNRIGEGLAPGVYFIRSLERKAGLGRIVKIR